MASNLCEKFIKGCVSVEDCDNIGYAGVSNTGWIANYADIDTVTYDSNNGNIVDGITMKTDGQDTKCFFPMTVMGNQPYQGSNTSLVIGDYGNRFTHVVNISILDNSPKLSNEVLDNLANGRFVVILENDFKDATGTNRYSIYGLAKGLKATNISRDLYDNEAAWICELSEEGNPKSETFVKPSIMSGIECDCQ